MKKYTALFMAVFMIVGIIGGGVVFSFSVRAASESFNFSPLPVVISSDDIFSNGAIICTDDNMPVYAGSSGSQTFISNGGSYIGVLSAVDNTRIVWTGSNNTTQTTNVNISRMRGNNQYYVGYRSASNFSNYTIPQYDYLGEAIFYMMCQTLYNKNVLKACHIVPTYWTNLSYVNTNQWSYMAIDNDSYAFAVKSGTGRASVFCSLTSNSGRGRGEGGSAGNYKFNNTITVNGHTFNYVVDGPNTTTETAILPTFDSVQDGFEWLENAIYNSTPDPDPDPDPGPNPGPAPITGGTTFVLKPGYACDIFYGGESYEVTARRIGQNRSSLFQINGSWWPYDNVLIANGVSTPITQNMDIYSSSEFSKIPWKKEPPYNLFGITYNSYYHVSGYDGHTVIANPVHYYGAGDGYNVPIQEQQTPIKITVSDEESQLTVYCWSLADSIDNNVITSTTVTRYTLGNDGMWYSDNNEMVVLDIGGETEVVNNQQATLDDLVSNIKTFFEGTWRHIRQLVTSAGKLPSVVVEMYSWLPEEYKSVLFSAFGIVTVVAILKVML